MKRVKLGIVVEKFPVLSQQFILRAVEELAKNDRLDITVLTIYPFSPPQLEAHSENGYRLYRDGKIKVKSFFDASKLRLSAKFVCAFLKYVLMMAFKRRLPLSTVLAVDLKYHVKAAIFSSLVRRESFDIVHAQFMDIAVYVCLAKCIYSDGFGIIFATGRGADITRTNLISTACYSILRNTNYGVDRLFFVSKSLRDMAVGLRGGKAKSLIVHSGIDISKFLFSGQFKQSAGPIRLIQVGRLVEKKGVMQSVKMVERITRDAKVDINLIVVGDGPLFEEACAYIHGRDLSHKVKLVGSKSNAECMRHIMNSDIMLVPSITAGDGNSEGIPNVAKEAMALGCIVVASDHSGLPELIEDGVTGFLFSEGSDDEFDKKMLEAISKRDEWASIAVNARRFVEERFASEKIAHIAYAAYVEALE